MGAGLWFRFSSAGSTGLQLMEFLRRQSMLSYANMPIAAAPAGLAMLSATLGLGLGDRWKATGIIGFALFGLVTVWFVARPPRWAKPDWLVEAEQSGRLR